MELVRLARRAGGKVFRAIKAKPAPQARNSGQNGRLPIIPLAGLLANCPDVTLRAIRFMDGNVSPLELLTISSLVADQRPRCILEIGTFNGNTTLQIAANAPQDATVYTLDLPIEQSEAPKAVDGEDTKYVASSQRAARRFKGSPEEAKIRELFGDSATFDFDSALDGRRIDLAFIDGSHSYAYVKSDTEKVMARLAPQSVVLWHDYQPFWPGVCDYLNELSQSKTLHQIEGTTLACHIRK
jgi:predicted O-methyltransferase YrrM